VEPAAPPTVTLAGLEPEGIGDFLRLGAVVVVAPDRPTLEAWIRERSRESEDGGGDLDRTELFVDHRAHAVMWRGRALELTELEYRMLGALASDTGRARSFRELRSAGWGETPDLGDDAFLVRSVIQRVRRKLGVAEIPYVVESVRGFGFRLAARSAEGRCVPVPPRDGETAPSQIPWPAHAN
jgi:Transcriptional regulatory protein, C terminal